MRKGQNPLKNSEAPAHFPPVVIAVITHLPDEQGYHKERFEIVNESIISLRDTAPDIPLLLWDNGSGERWRSWLRAFDLGDYLMLSPNIGKSSARAAILNMLPPETIVAISDDDMEFSAGWLEAHMALLEGFPNVGMVSGFPNRFSGTWGIDSTLAWATEQPQGTIGVDFGQYIPNEWEVDYAKSIGADPERILTKFRRMDQYRIRYNGLEALAQASHCQFMCIAGRIAPLTTYATAALGDERPFDEAVDKAGYLRLTTTQRFTRHMGNVPD